MKKESSRRSFLRKSAIAATGLTLLSSTQFIQAATRKRNPYKGYNPFPPLRNDLRKFPFIGNHVSVSGTLYNKKGTSVQSNASIEVWHVSPNSKKYNHCAKLYTDQNGKFSFKTDFPNAVDGMVPRIFFKVTHKQNVEFTEVLISTSGAQITSDHWERNQALGKKLYPVTSETMSRTNVQFNLSI